MKEVGVERYMENLGNIFVDGGMEFVCLFIVVFYI